MALETGRDTMKTELCQVLNKIGALKFGTFKLTSGRTSPYYIDLRVVPSFPDAFQRVCDLYQSVIEGEIGAENFDRIAGIPTSGISFASVIAYSLRKPFLYVRPRVRLHGRERRIEGVVMPGDRVLLIDDVCTTGSTLETCSLALREKGVSVVWGLVLARERWR